MSNQSGSPWGPDPRPDEHRPAGGPGPFGPSVPQQPPAQPGFQPAGAGGPVPPASPGPVGFQQPGPQQSGPQQEGPQQPNWPQHAPAPAPAKRGSGLLLGLIVGTLVGALVMGGLWFARVLPTREPTPVKIGMDSLPATFMGNNRVDIEWQNKGNADNAQKARDRILAQIPMMRFATGKDGIFASYGLMSGAYVTVTVTNGRAAIPAPRSDLDHEVSGTLSGFIESYDDGQTQCVFYIAETIQLSGQTPAQAREKLLSTPTSANKVGYTYCGSYDASRDLGVASVVDGKSGTPAEQARQQAKATLDALKAIK